MLRRPKTAEEILHELRMETLKLQSYLDKHLTKFCWSCWDGCSCGLKKGHKGLHKCANRSCKDRWTDEQEQEFMDDLRKLSNCEP